MAQIKNMIRNLLSRTASNGDTGDQAEARELLALIDAAAPTSEPTRVRNVEYARPKRITKRKGKAK